MCLPTQALQLLPRSYCPEPVGVPWAWPGILHTPGKALQKGFLWPLHLQ